MHQRPPWLEPFIQKLQVLVDTQDRAALADLRRGLGKDPSYVLVRRGGLFVQIPDRQHSLEMACLVASLFTTHSQVGGNGSLGRAFRALREQTNSDSIDARFVALIDSHRDDLVRRLRHAISLLSSKAIPVDWGCLLDDLLRWNRGNRPVQRNWARDYWSQRQATDKSESLTETSNTL